MNTLAPIAMTANNYVSAAGGRSAAPTKKEEVVETPGEQVAISDAARTDKPSAKGLGRIGKLVAALALAGAVLGTSGCAVTTGGYNGWGGYQTQTMGVTPNGTVYYQQQQTPIFVPQQPIYVPHHHHHGCTPMTWWGPGTCY